MPDSRIKLSDFYALSQIKMKLTPSQWLQLDVCGSSPAPYPPWEYMEVWTEVKRWLSYKKPGRGTPLYKLHGYVMLWKVWFLSSLVCDRVKKSESFGLE